MNAAVRAATAVCLSYGVPIYAIHDVREEEREGEREIGRERE